MELEQKSANEKAHLEQELTASNEKLREETKNLNDKIIEWSTKHRNLEQESQRLQELCQTNVLN